MQTTTHISAGAGERLSDQQSSLELMHEYVEAEAMLSEEEKNTRMDQVIDAYVREYQVWRATQPLRRDRGLSSHDQWTRTFCAIHDLVLLWADMKRARTQKELASHTKAMGDLLWDLAVALDIEEEVPEVLCRVVTP